MSGSGALRIDGLFHRYGNGPEVLADVALELAAGESLALLGPSGCGKTTLLRSVAGLERPTAGIISIDGDTLVGPGTWTAPEKRRVGMVFQDWALFPHLNVARNIGYGLGRDDRSARVDDALAMVGLEGLGDRMPSTLSGGQQQRVALARALAPRPRLLLLDEPFSNLDTNLRTDVRAEVRRLLLDLGITAVFVTHDQEEAFVLGDRVAVMNEGRITQIDTPQRLYAAPATRWVAEFIGDASILDGEATGGSATTALGSVPLTRERTGPVAVLIRPEQLSIVPDGAATVELIEFYGHDAMVYLRLEERSIKVRTAADVPLTRGDRVGVAFTGPAAHTFDNCP
ncbi:MAG: ABC transporter ATP-binding protein [Actinomycetota bacterium]